MSFSSFHFCKIWVSIFCSVDLSSNGVSATGAVGNVNSIEQTLDTGFSATGQVGSVEVLESDLIASGAVGTVTVSISDGGNVNVNV